MTQPPDSTRCLVVMYHYVRGRTQDARDACVSSGGVRGLTVDAFGAQIDRLCATAEPIDWPSLYAWTQGRYSLPRECFLLTFDDGLADHARHVAPILEARGLRGVFFVSGGTLTISRMLPAHAIHLLLSRLGDERLESELRGVLATRADGRQWCASLNRLLEDPDGALTSFYHYEAPRRAALKYWLTMSLPIALRNHAVVALFEKHVGSTSRWAEHWYLSWENLAALQAGGHTIGGHGFSHEPLARLSPHDQRRDMVRVAAVLAEGLGSDVRPFSFPYGSVTAETRQLCHESGFAHGFITERDWLTADSCLTLLPRVDTIHVDTLLGARSRSYQLSAFSHQPEGDNRQDGHRPPSVTSSLATRHVTSTHTPVEG